MVKTPKADRSHFALRRMAGHAAMKAEDIAYWQSQPTHVRMQKVTELSISAYALKGIRNAPGLRSSLVRIKRA